MNTVRESAFAVIRALLAGIDPEGYLRRRGKVGDPFLVRFPGLGEILFVASREGAKDVLTAPTTLCRAPTPNPIEPIVGESSLILLSGDPHRRMRGLLMPALQGERIGTHLDAIAAAAHDAVSTLREGAAVDVRELARTIALDVVIRVVFGVAARERRAEYADVIGALMEANTTGLMLAPALRRDIAGLGPWPRLLRLRDRLDTLLSQDIDRRRGTTALVDGHDMLDLIVSATDEVGARLTDGEMHEQLRTLLAAGHETSATSLTWALYYIHRDHAIRQRVLEELADRPTLRDLTALPYLGAVIAETLRMHPTVSIVLRRLTAPFAIEGIERAAGDIVGVALPALHFNPEIWPEPERFRPERFLERKPSPFEYAPFGGGYRRCIGASFATFELAVSLGTILGAAELELGDHERRRPPPRAVARGIAAVPHREVRLDVVRLRSES